MNQSSVFQLLDFKGSHTLFRFLYFMFAFQLVIYPYINISLSVIDLGQSNPMSGDPWCKNLSNFGIDWVIIGTFVDARLTPGYNYNIFNIPLCIISHNSTIPQYYLEHHNQSEKYQSTVTINTLLRRISAFTATDRFWKIIFSFNWKIILPGGVWEC